LRRFLMTRRPAGCCAIATRLLRGVPPASRWHGYRRGPVGSEFSVAPQKPHEGTRFAVIRTESVSPRGFTQDGSDVAIHRSARRDSQSGPGPCGTHSSRRHRRLILPATMRLPSIRTDTRAGGGRVPARFRRAPVPLRTTSPSRLRAGPPRVAVVCSKRRH
jgi:hypothetical protein